MTSKSPKPAAEPSTAQMDPIEQKAAEIEHEVVAEREDIADEVVAEIELLPAFVHMVHKDEGGNSDAFEKNDAGHHMVPVEQVQTALDHGFIPAAN